MFKAQVPLYNESLGLDVRSFKAFVGMALGAAALMAAFGVGNWLVSAATEATGTEDQVNVPVIG